MIETPRCAERNCKHLQGVKQLGEDEVDQVVYCRAFPDGIPNEIAYGDNLHTEPLKGQGNDIVYEQEEEEE